ncbi:formate/nitrite transporter family protein [Micromonospora globispora]|uniref:formate/nitrite transporter family protein n=1 Tax=Micromonospora globispora TaxID=1450148 RepID=UPI001A9C484D|nr:formate/nitrite transporter family protein [Micromonospora globispora]
MAYERLAAIAQGKALHESNWQIFLRGVGCNWLVCLGVWLALAADNVSGKILGIFFPIMAFVAMGFDHVVANMFFLPAAIWAGVPDLGLARRAQQLALRVPRQPGRRGGLRGHLLLVPVPQGRTEGRAGAAPGGGLTAARLPSPL